MVRAPLTVFYTGWGYLRQRTCNCSHIKAHLFAPARSSPKRWFALNIPIGHIKHQHCHFWSFCGTLDTFIKFNFNKCCFQNHFIQAETERGRREANLTSKTPFGRWTSGSEQMCLKRCAVALADIHVYFTHTSVRRIVNGSNNTPYICQQKL